MVLNKIPTFEEVKNWANSTLVTSVNGSTGDVSVEGTPSGVISMWSGSTQNIPSGWTLCDGTDGTPDLTDRFVVGSGNEYSTGDVGGEKTVTLTEEQLASHSHDAPVDVSSGSASDNFGGGYRADTTITTESAGGDQPHENRPPYHALAYIMKV